MKEGTEVRAYRAPISLNEKIEAEAKKENRTFSNMVCTILKKYFEV